MASVSNDNSSKVAYSYLQFKNKIGGLVSGMDIDSIMEKLMKAESAQMEKLQQQKQKYEWKRDAYRDVNTKFTTFEQNIFDNYGKPSNWALKTVSNSDSSKVSAVATGSATGELSISVNKLATSANLQTTLENGITKESTMSELGFTGGGSFIISALDSTGVMDDGVEINYSATDKVSDVLDKISQKTNVSVINLDNKISFMNKNTGKADTSIDVLGDTNGLFKRLGLSPTNVTTGYYNFDNQDGFQKGANAEYTVNGIRQEKSSNKFSVSGYDVELKATTSGNIKISSTTDTEKVVDKVKSFVETYNNLIKDMNDKTTEKRNVDYTPLTDAQKAEMTTDEITKWEEKAKAGLLKGDSNINATISSMRLTISNMQDSLSEIGVTISSIWSDNGKLEFDENKLKTALEKNPDAVSKVFLGENNENGLIKNLRTTAQSAVKNIELTAGKSSSTEKSYSLGITISGLTDKISDWKDRLKDIEERYWSQFSAMEKAIQKANSQTSIFSA